MHSTRRPLLLLLVLVALLGVAAGCGGTSEGESSSGAATDTSGSDSAGSSPAPSGSGDVDTSSPSYQGGYELCQEGPLEYVAGLFGAEPTREAVARAVAEQVGGAAGAEDFAAGRQGCLDAFATNR